MEKKEFILYVRNFIFGAEDSLVSTVGLLSGIFFAGVSQREIIVSGSVLIFVEAFSMSVGSFLSESSTEESYPHFKKRESNSIVAALIMFMSYLISGIFPLFPYLIFTSGSAFLGSVILSFIALFCLGFFSAKILKIKVLKNSLRTVILGGFAIIFGIVVGSIIK